MKYSISIESKEHIKIHFGVGNKAGSSFNSELFNNVDQVLSVIENKKPESIVSQNNLREAHTYNLTDVGIIGYLGVGKREDFKNNPIITEQRNGCLVDFIEVDELPATSFLTLICEKKNEKLDLITLFPGQYAPAFANPNMHPDERMISQIFWSENILLKKTT